MKPETTSYKQQLKNSWAGTLLFVAILGVGAILVLGVYFWGFDVYDSSMVFGILLILILAYNMSMHVNINETCIRIKIGAFTLERISIDDIRNIDIDNIDILSATGGWGIRRGRNLKGYIIQGNNVLKITLKDGKRVLVTCPLEFQLPENYSTLYR